MQSVRKWSGILIKVGTAQAIVQAVQIATGIWIIRCTPKAEYAYYTIANALFFAILLLADSGVTASLWAAGGKAWQDSQRLGQLLRSALIIRRHLAVLVAAVVIPVLIGLLIRNKAPAPRAVLLGAIVCITVVGELTTHTYMVVFRLRSQFNFTQRVALAGAVGRILWLAVFSLGHLRAELAFLASSMNTCIQWFLLRRNIGRHADWAAERDPLVERETKNIVSRQLALNIYYCLQGQIGVWLASTFGGANEVSDVGALGRFSALFAVSMSVMQEVVFPAFAREQSPEIVRKRYVHITAAYSALLVMAVLIIALFRSQVLQIFGRQYSRLSAELVLAVTYAAVNALTQVLWTLNYSRAWIIPPAPYIAVTSALQLGLFFMINVSTVRGILWFSILSLTPSVVFPIWLSIRNIRVLGCEHAEALAEPQSA